MRLRAVRRIRFWCRVTIAAGLLVIVGMEYARPWLAGMLYAKEYKQLAYECDHAMHEEAALRLYSDNPEKAQLLRISADVGLVVCHEYDKLRKKMLIWGITDDQLALYGLEVLEIERIPVSRMVEPHRMDRF